MHTFFVLVNDTNIGKTHVVLALASELSENRRSVQIIKPVETGIRNFIEGDAPSAALMAGIDSENTRTLLAYPDPIAPRDAAEKQDVVLSLDLILSAYAELTPVDVRIVEGAGGIAVPIDKSDADWTDFIKRAPDDMIVLLVVENRLGAINQARTLMHYTRSQGLKPYLLLNETSPQSEDILLSNYKALCKEKMSYLGRLRFEEKRIDWYNGGLSTLLNCE